MLLHTVKNETRCTKYPRHEHLDQCNNKSSVASLLLLHSVFYKIVFVFVIPNGIALPWVSENMKHLHYVLRKQADQPFGFRFRRRFHFAKARPNLSGNELRNGHNTDFCK